jgi:hypothetical protein
VSTTSEAWIVSLESLAGALSYCVKILSAIPLLSLHETEFELTYFVHCKSLNVKVEQCTVLQKSQIVLPKETRIDDKWSQAQPPAGCGEAISWLHMLGGGGDVIVAALPQESHVTLFTPEPVELDLLFIETGICQMTSDSAKKTADFVNFCYTLPL